MATQGDVDALIAGQEGALTDCDSARAQLVGIIDKQAKGR